MNVLVNFSTLKAGGGQTVGLNFVSRILEKKQFTNNYYFIVAKDSAIHNFLVKKRYFNFTLASRNPIIRILSEFFFSRKLIKKYHIDIVYSYFGIGIFPKNIPQVTGAADSNLYFPEINFWNGYKGLSLLKKRIVDKYRIWGLKRADGIVFENKLLEEKFHQIFGFSAVTKFIKPSINISQDSKEFNLPLEAKSSSKRGLFLCGWHLNKNVMLIPEIANEIKKKNIDFHFVLTAPEDNSGLHRQFMGLIKKFDVDKHISIVGPVPKEELASLYSKVDLVFLLSKLESFSNNIIESWYFNKVLIISDEDWSKALCNDAALYVDRNSSKKIADAIEYIINNPASYNKIIYEGRKELKKYPGIDERVEEEIKFIRFVFENA